MESKNKVVLVTGSSRGMGRAEAIEFARRGYDVIVHYFGNKAKAEEVKSEIEKLGANAAVVQADLRKKEEIEILAEKAEALFGKIDVLVNNAGITRDGLSFRMKKADWDDVLRINLTSSFLICQIVSNDMIRKRAGSIINMSSIVGIHGNGGQVNYAASKGGLIAYSKSLAQEVGGRGVRVNAIAPGFIATDMTKVLKEDLQKAMIEKIPLKRAGTPEDIANAALFLASDLSSYITAQVIGVDGGMGA